MEGHKQKAHRKHGDKAQLHSPTEPQPEKDRDRKEEEKNIDEDVANRRVVVERPASYADGVSAGETVPSAGDGGAAEEVEEEDER